MPIRLQVLGGLQAFQDDVQLAWVPSHRIRSELLVYLALEREVPRERLAGVFWPDQESDRAQHALSQALYRLRQTFGDDFIVQNGTGLRFGVPVACDALDFEQLVERGDLAGAMAIYRGAFLKDVAVGGGRELDAWVDQQRAKYARLHRRACSGWIDGLVRDGKLSEAIEAARGWTALEPFDDEAQHRLIELLAASGQRSEALVQYDQYERLLKAEGLTPLDETMALVAQLRAGGRGNGGAMAPTSGDSAAPSPPTVLRAEATAPPPGVNTPSGTAALRGPEAGALKSRRAWIAAGVGAVLLLLGAAGVWALRSRLPAPPPPGVREPVVVLPFEAMGSDPELDELGVQAAEGIAAAIEREKLGKVVHYAGVGSGRPFTRRLGRRVVADTRAGTVVTGVIAQSRDRVEIQARVLRGHDLATIWTLGPERGSGTDPTGALDAIRERVLGAVGWYLGPAGEAKNPSITQPPPSVETLRLATKAGESLAKADLEEAIEYYRRAYARDTTYLHPLRMLYPPLMNSGNWLGGDSVLAMLEARRSRLYRLDALVLDKFNGQRGSPEAEVEAAHALFNADSGAYDYVRSLLRARRATEALRYYRLRDTTRVGNSNWQSWDAAAGTAYHTLGRFEEHLAIARAARALEPRNKDHWLDEVSALGALGRTQEIDGLITASYALEAFRMPARLLGLAADELSFHGFDTEARAYAERALVALKAWPTPRTLADSAKIFGVWVGALYVVGRYEEVVRMNDEGARRLGKAGLPYRVMAAYHRIPMGDTAGALALADSARTQPSSAFAAVGWGGTKEPQLMWASGILALLGRKDEAVATIREAMNNGMRLDGDSPLSECWIPLRDHPGFKELTRVR